MEQTAVQKFARYCTEVLDFTNLNFQDRYQSLSVCLVDCIYSLRARYLSTTVPVVQRYADAYLLGDRFASGDTLDAFLNRVDLCGGCNRFADEVLKNNQKLSGRNKTEICYELADKMSRLLCISTLADFQSFDKPELLDIVLCSVKGFGDAGLNYLYMLAGDSSRCKPDVHIHHCIVDAIGKDISNVECQVLLTAAVELLRSKYPELTVRGLDYLIWNKYQIGRQ